MRADKQRKLMLAILREDLQTPGSKAKLCRRVGIDPANLSKFLGKNANPTLKTLTRIANALKYDVELRARA